MCRPSPWARKGLALARAHTHLWGVGRAHYVLGRVAAARGDLARARELLEHALQAQRQLPYQQGIVWTLYELGPILFEQAESARAREVLAEGLTLALASGQRVSIAQGLEAFANVLADANPESAVLAAAAAAGMRDVLASRVPPEPRKHLDARLTVARANLGEPRWSRTWKSGRALSPEQACNLALAADVPATA